MKLVPRYSTERGNADHGWLKTFHTLQFPDVRYGRHVLTLGPCMDYWMRKRFKFGKSNGVNPY